MIKLTFKVLRREITGDFTYLTKEQVTKELKLPRCKQIGINEEGKGILLYSKGYKLLPNDYIVTIEESPV